MATETTKLTFVEGAAATTPASGRGVIYFKADGLLYSKDDAGVETLCSNGAAGMSNPLTTTGDIIYSSSGTTAARRAVGSTGDVLTVAGGVPTWAAPAAAGGTTVKVRKAAQSIGNGTKLAFDTEIWDPDGWHDNAVNNSRLTCPAGKDGIYIVGSSAFMSGSGRLEIFKNGSVIEGRGNSGYASNYGNTIGLVSVVATNYIEINLASGGTIDVGDGGSAGDYAVFWMAKLA